MLPIAVIYVIAHAFSKHMQTLQCASATDCRLMGSTVAPWLGLIIASAGSCLSIQTLLQTNLVGVHQCLGWVFINAWVELLLIVLAVHLNTKVSIWSAFLPLCHLLGSEEGGGAAV